jgi:hypothetical protein
MTKGTDWKKEYLLLGEFVAAHPEIVIKNNEVSIPQNRRDEFYRRFDDIRKYVVLAHYDSLPAEIGVLSDNYVRIEKEVNELLGLEKIIMPMDLSSFLHDPKEGLARVIYNRLFETLQGKITLQEFEERAGNEIRAASSELFRLGYEFWATLVLIKLLEPGEAFLVDLNDDYKPYPKEIKDISFGRQAHHPTIRIPEFVLHSRKLNQYVAFKMSPVREIETFIVHYRPRSKPRKKTGDTSLVLDSRAVILSFIPSLEDIPVLADIYECTHTNPHWIIEYIRGSDLDNPDAIQEVERHRKTLNPKLGTCLILMDNEYEDRLQDVPSDIRTVAMGFDASRLEAVVDSIAKES